MLITADHGNAEMMIDPATGGPHTAHTTNPVPFIVVSEDAKRFTLAAGRFLAGHLADDARACLELNAAQGNDRERFAGEKSVNPIVRRDKKQENHQCS